MDILINIGWIVLGLVLLTKGADLFVNGAVRLSLRLGISAAIVGATVVAFGTSAPELITAVMAASKGQVDLALGNIVGSNICNICIAVGATAMIKPMKTEASIVRWDGPFFLIAALALVAFVWLIPVEASTATDGLALGFSEGVMLLVIFGLFMATSVVRGLRSRGTEVSEEVVAARAEVKTKPWWGDVVLFALGLVGLIVGSDRLVVGAAELATLAGIPQFVIGVTIVAIGTSLPEIITSLMAAIKGQSDLAIANVTGSNIQNIILCLGAAVVASSLGYIPVAHGIAVLDLSLMLGVTLLLFGFMVYKGGHVGRIHGGVLVSIYIAYVVVLITGSQGV